MRPGVALFVLCLFGVTASAQQPFSEKIEVSITNVDVVVTDHGKPVHGLTADDFEVFEDGVPQKITNFEAVDSQNGADAKDDRIRRKILVLLSMRASADPKLAKTISNLHSMVDDPRNAGSEWSIASVDYLVRMRLPPTTDKAAIHAALDRLATRVVRPPPQTRTVSFDAVDALVEAAHAFAATGGRKIILMISGFLLAGDSASPGATGLNMPVNQNGLERDFLIEEVNASNVAVYVINPWRMADPGMYWITRTSGGRIYANTTEMPDFSENSANYYSLGYRANHADDGKYRHIKVRLKSHRYALQYREGATSLPNDERIQRALGSSLGASMLAATQMALPVTINFDDPRQSENGVILRLTATVAAERLQPRPEKDVGSRFSFYLSVFDETGLQVRSTRFDRDASLNDAAVGDQIDQYFMSGKRYRIVVVMYDSLTGELGVSDKTGQF